MKKTTQLLIILIFFISTAIQAQEKAKENAQKIDTRIDNMGYWRKMAAKGYVPVEPIRSVPKATFKGSKINSKSVNIYDSPDVPVNDAGDNTQSETSIFVNPANNSMVLNSNNSTSWSGGSVGSVYGANYFLSDDVGQTWGGSTSGAGGGNNGDPSAVINLDGTRQYIGFIDSSGGMGVSYSTDGGTSWTEVTAASGSLDKNHLCIDNNPTSPYEGNLYNAWTEFSGAMDTEIGFVYSTDEGLSYSSTANISSAVNAGSHNQGVNLQTGPNGEVYATWAIYDSWPSDETAIGFAKSTDGGVTFTSATRIISNIKGIRNSEVSKNQRVNSFPVMAVDISGGSNNGNIYIVWTNIGVPGTNSGTNRSIYMIKSTDGGATWETPIRVNQGTFAEGKEAYLPWITCDPETGVLSTIFYDDRDVSSTEVETWVSNSYDAGDTWEDFRVSDVAFTPQPISGLATGYMGDYLGISARGSMVYPVWPDNRNGYVQTFVSPFETNNRDKASDLMLNLTFATGQVDLTWNYTGSKTFQNFIVYRDGVEIGTTTNTNFTDMLPTYGLYTYGVTVMHQDGESAPIRKSIQWGDPHINVNPVSLTETLLTNETSTKILTIENTGELDLTYSIDSEIITSKNTTVYCSADGGGDEYISGVEFGSIANTGTGASGYGDYTAMSTDVDAGNTYSITITNGNTYSTDDLGIWIDWNQDEDFDDAGEEVVCETSNNGEGTYDIVVPSNALGGSTIMRVRIKYYGSDCGDPCGTTTYGEVEDYTINVNSWLQIASFSGLVQAGETEQINVNFDSEDLAQGDYTATITINSNDTGIPEVLVPVTLHVVGNTNLNTTATADLYSICEGSTTTLHANPTGGSGSYTYSWTSVPTGFTSTDENPSVSPVEDTTYTVTVNDGNNTETSSVSIVVMELLTQPNAPTGDTNLCQDAVNSTYTTQAVSGASSYEWTLTPSTAGSITATGLTAEVNWSSSFNGAASIQVGAVNDCGTSPTSELTVTINELPIVVLVNLSSVCINTPTFTLTGGNPIGGTYSGVGVTGGDQFNPAAAGVGTHTITYTYTNANGCANYDTKDITVNPIPTVSLSPFPSVYDNEPPFVLTGGNPIGGVYSGVGVSNGSFDPSVAGAGIHTITYTYTNSEACDNFATETIEVISTIGIDDIDNAINFNIYPNPNNGKLFIDINSISQKDLSITFYNQLGMLVLKENIQVSDTVKKEFNIENFTQGVYYISITGDKLKYVRKIIVQK